MKGLSNGQASYVTNLIILAKLKGKESVTFDKVFTTDKEINEFNNKKGYRVEEYTNKNNRTMYTIQWENI